MLLCRRLYWPFRWALTMACSTVLTGPTVLSPQQYWYIGHLEYCLFSNAFISASVLNPLVSSYLGLQNCPRSRYPRDVYNIVIPAAHLYAEGRIVFTFHVVSKAHFRVYNNVSSAVLIARPGVLSPQQCSYLGLCIDFLGELLPCPDELSSQQIS